jgi:hypothetical protein
MLEIIQVVLEERDQVLLYGIIKDVVTSRWPIEYNTHLHSLTYALKPMSYDKTYLAKFEGKK